ncbi:TPA: Arc family DNA-binding protein [Klebsiella pneumoniae]
MRSLNYQSDKPIIKTASAEKLISLAVRFEEWISDLLGIEGDNPEWTGSDNAENEHLWVWCEGEKKLIPGKASGYSMRIPENLAEEVRVMARVHGRSLNEEMLSRIMNSLGYYSQRVLEQNEDAQALKVLSIEFEKYLIEKITEAERVLKPRRDGEGG